MKVRDPLKFVKSVLKRDRPRITEIQGFSKDKVYLINLEFDKTYSRVQAQQYATTILECFRSAGITVMVVPRYDNLVKIECSEISSKEGLELVQ